MPLRQKGQKKFASFKPFFSPSEVMRSSDELHSSICTLLTKPFPNLFLFVQNLTNHENYQKEFLFLSFFPFYLVFLSELQLRKAICSLWGSHTSNCLKSSAILEEVQQQQKDKSQLLKVIVHKLDHADLTNTTKLLKVLHAPKLKYFILLTLSYRFRI